MGFICGAGIKWSLPQRNGSSEGGLEFRPLHGVPYSLVTETVSGTKKLSETLSQRCAQLSDQRNLRTGPTFHSSTIKVAEYFEHKSGHFL